MIHHATKLKVGENRGAPRVWLEGKYLLKAGFAPNDFIELEFNQGKLVVRKSKEASNHKVSSRSNGIPIIDLNSQKLKQSIVDAESVQVYVGDEVIAITTPRIRGKKATRTTNGLEGAIFAGGGLLSEAARQAGYTPGFAIEIDPGYAQVYQDNHPEASMWNLPIEEVVPKYLPKVELLTIGIPCEPYSVARRNGPKGVPPEAHPLGDMVFWAAKLLDYLNPKDIIIEEVPKFLESGAGFILLNILERLGYTVETAVHSPNDFGYLSGRKRAVIVAHSGQYKPPTPRSTQMTVSDILDSNPEGWFTPETKPWIFKHWEKQTAKGNGFASTVILPDATRIPTIKKRYFAQQGDNPVLPHPTDKDTFRFFSIGEVRRIMGLPDSFILPAAKTRAGEVMGQGVDVNLFTDLIGGLHA